MHQRAFSEPLHTSGFLSREDNPRPPPIAFACLEQCCPARLWHLEEKATGDRWARPSTALLSGRPGFPLWRAEPRCIQSSSVAEMTLFAVGGELQNSFLPDFQKEAWRFDLRRGGSIKR